MSFDPADPAFLDDPYPTFAALRAVAPVHEHALLGTPVAVSHAACSAVLRGRDLGRIWADAQPATEFAAFNLLHRNSLLEREGDPHDRLRTLVAGVFQRGHTARLEPRVRALADRLVADLAARIADAGSAEPPAPTPATSSPTSRSASARTAGSRRAVCPRWKTPATSVRSRSCGSPSRSSSELRCSRLNAVNAAAGSVSAQIRRRSRPRSTAEHAACDTATGMPSSGCSWTGPSARSAAKVG